MRNKEWDLLAEWCIIRLELGRTPQFPNGSPSRSFLLRLPLDSGGRIDASVRAADPRGATVRRYWPQQPDRSGWVVPLDGGWAFSQALSDWCECFSRLPDQSFCLGGSVTVSEEEILPFTVVHLKRVEPAAASRA